MKSSLRIRPRLVRSVLLSLLVGSGLAAAQAQPSQAINPPRAPQPSLAQALEAAWARSLESAESRGQLGLAAAERRVAEAWLAGAPALEISQRQGRGAAAAGARETEIGVQLPLWRFGQRQLGTQAAQVEQDWAQAAEQAARLRLLGQLRELSGSLHAAQVDLQMAELQALLLQQLSVDVDRRVKAGDLAPADALAAKAEWLSAKALASEAEQVLRGQASAWRLLTGFDAEPAPEPALDGLIGAQSPQQHPAQRLLELGVERARQRVALGQAQRGAQPELGLSLRQEQPGSGQSAQSSVAVSLRMPFGSDPPQRTQQLAAALAEQGLALAAAQRSQLQIEAEQALARARLKSSAAQESTERERAALLRERAQLLDKSFKLGETALPELLRALNAAAQADAAAARQALAHALAQARFQQAFGVFP
ncbi:TolC family protein [Roseateles oligotrophus]|uniref:TolC family protein n=1 Tax=Roseateles oligotrophus TaxID=1769250 RepID=A0ABT2YCU6_9BURK|nr:TolC family protein [Roseateles oligotrophus]MCV2367860.1 TolC family protein [Roseateles oligotrophus]